MHAAQITTLGSPPVYTTIPEPPSPSPTETRLTLLATGIHRLVRSRASGTHYTTTTLPHTPGVDGVGRTTETGELVYFSTLSMASGSFADTLNVPNHSIFKMPTDADPVRVAAGVNPALSGWLAMQLRCEDLPAGFSVLVLGVTSASGRMAVGLAKALGAGKVVGVARNEATMETIDGLDEKIVLKAEEGGEGTNFEGVGHVDVVLDYLYGLPAEQLFKGMAKWEKGKKTQYVQVGGLAGPEVRLNSASLKGRDLVMRGSGLGSWTLPDMAKELPKLLEVVVELKGGDVRVEKLADVEKVWGEDEDGRRIVFVP